jgi:hypothetical protein
LPPTSEPASWQSNPVPRACSTWHAAMPDDPAPMTQTSAMRAPQPKMTGRHSGMTASIPYGCRSTAARNKPSMSNDATLCRGPARSGARAERGGTPPCMEHAPEYSWIRFGYSTAHGLDGSSWRVVDWVQCVSGQP